RRHTRSYGDWSSDVCSSDLPLIHSLGKLQIRLRQPKRLAEPLGTLTGKQSMIGLLHNEPRQAYGVFCAPNKSDPRAPSSLPIHDSSISLNITNKIQG